MSLHPLKGGNFVHQPPANSDGGSFMKRFSLTGKTAVISGGGAGIGYAVAQAYAEMGANVGVWYASNKRAIERAKEIAEKYGVLCENLFFFIISP
jgi:sorbose reductase